MDNKKRFLISLFCVISGIPGIECIIKSGTVHAAVSQGGEPDCINQHTGFFRGGNKGDHKAGCPVFQVPVKQGRFECWRPQHAIDIKQMEKSHQRLNLTGFHSSVFGIQPYAVESTMACMADVGGD